MKSLGGLVITWVWWAIIFEAVVIKPSIITKESTSLGYKTLLFNLEGATEQVYRSFIQSLRNELAKGTSVCQFPVTPQSIAAEEKRFVLVDLTTTSKKTITLAIHVTDVYAVGYLDQYNGKDRAVFLAGVPDVSKLFPDATIENLTFSGSYPSLQNAAKENRANLELGVNKLEFFIESIYGKAIKGKDNKDIAKFFLIAIQMISEAARFKYIENEVVTKGLSYGSFKPNPKVLKLETSWDAISDAIHNSSPQCTTIDPALKLTNPSNGEWVVDKVSEIRPDLGILKFKSSKLTQFTTIIRSIVVEDLDGDELEIQEPNVA